MIPLSSKELITEYLFCCLLRPVALVEKMLKTTGLLTIVIIPYRFADSKSKVSKTPDSAAKEGLLSHT